MNATEQIIEIYYRHCKHFFTYTDYKVPHGNNRQLDVLALNHRENKLHHIEVGVTHNEHWTANLAGVREQMRHKFFGFPKNNRPDNPNTDFNRGRNYQNEIRSCYESIGFSWKETIRVWCLWWHTNDQNEINLWKKELASEFNLSPDNFELLSMRDTVIPCVLESIGTSNYDDPIMRTISLLRQFELQTGRE